MQLPEVLMIVLGVIAPPVWQLVIRYIPSRLMRFLTALCLSAVTGVAAIVLIKQPLSFTVEGITLLFTFSQLAFATVWRKLFNDSDMMRVQY